MILGLKSYDNIHIISDYQYIDIHLEMSLYSTQQKGQTRSRGNRLRFVEYKCTTSQGEYLYMNNRFIC